MSLIRKLLAGAALALVLVAPATAGLHFHGAASGATFTTWDPANKGTSVVLSNGNLTVENGGAIVDGLARSVASTTGKVHFEVTIVTLDNPTHMVVGVCDSSANLNDFLGASTNSYGITMNGTQVYGGSSGGVLAISLVAGDTLVVEFDAAAKTIQFQKAGSGSWVTGATFGNVPAAASLYACIDNADAVGGVSGKATANFGATTFLVGQSPGYGTF